MYKVHGNHLRNYELRNRKEFMKISCLTLSNLHAIGVFGLSAT